MQSSGSFELARQGRSRPGNLLPVRSHSYDTPIASPSFNSEHAFSSKVSIVGKAHQHRESKIPISLGTLPPTPLTANAPVPTVALPGIDAMLANASINAQSAALNTPPSSVEMPMRPRLGCADEHESAFVGPRPEWVQEQGPVTFADVHAPPTPAATSSRLAPRSTPRMSPYNLSSLLNDSEFDGFVGLGVTPTEHTPRVGTLSTSPLGQVTPTQSGYNIHPEHIRDMPVTPSLPQEGVFPTTIPSSPIVPSLDNWNVDLTFDAEASKSDDVADEEFVRRTPTSAPMVRETKVLPSGSMPSSAGARGLGISMDGSMDFSAIAGPSTERATSGLDVSRSLEIHAPAIDRQSTGLTPTLGTARISHAATEETPAPASPASPTLRTTSKKRSDLVRKQAEAAVKAGLAKGALGAECASPATENELKNKAMQDAAHCEDATSPPHRKRHLGERDDNSQPSTTFAPTASSKAAKGSRSASPCSSAKAGQDNSSSPWGVFRVKSEGWKSLGPPGGGKAPGVNALRPAPSSAPPSARSTPLPEVEWAASKKSKRPVDRMAVRPASAVQANKENIPMARSASMVGGKTSSQRPLAGGANAKRPLTSSSRRDGGGGGTDVFGGPRTAVTSHPLTAVPTSASAPSQRRADRRI